MLFGCLAAGLWPSPAGASDRIGVCRNRVAVNRLVVAAPDLSLTVRSDTDGADQQRSRPHRTCRGEPTSDVSVALRLILSGAGVAAGVSIDTRSYPTGRATAKWRFSDAVSHLSAALATERL